MPRQLTLDFNPSPHRARADFQLGPANRAGIELVDRWPEWPAPVVILAGPEACGKSHLVAMLAATAPTTILFAASADWHGTAAELALAATGAASHGRLVVVEDAGPGLDEAGLFHLINAVGASGAALLITARVLPGDWRLTLPDLISRLRAATPVVIDAPDDALLEAVIAKHFADRQLVVDPGVIRYSIARMERSFAAALDLVVRLDAQALARKSPITRALVADLLQDGGVQGDLPGLEAD